MDKPSAPHYHHHLVCATIEFVLDGVFQTSSQNAVLKVETNYITVADLGRAQRLAQQLFFNTIPPDQDMTSFGIKNVVINSISYLGLMTQEAFFAGQEEVPAETN